MDCEVGRVVRVCKSSEKGGQEGNDKTERRHDKFSYQDKKMEGVTTQERICKECKSGEVEDEDHWLLRSEAW